MMQRVRPKKSLGQHFLTDPNIAQKIAGIIPSRDLPLLEVGPGMGMLTQFLLKRENPLKVIEIDAESVQFLRSHFPSMPGEDILHGDYLKTDFSNHFADQFGIIGNFPYNISSQILFTLVDHHEKIPVLCGMFQKEVAERIASGHNTRQYGILSVLLQTWYHISIQFSVSEKVFSPPPNVQSAVVLISAKDQIPVIGNPGLYKKVVKAAFSQRRKMLKNPLSAAFGFAITTSFAGKRAEQLSVTDFLQLYNEIEALINERNSC